MDSTVSTTTSTISAISKTISHRRPTQSIIRSQLAFLRLPRTLTSSRFPHRSTEFNSISPSSYLRSLTAASAVVPPLCFRPATALVEESEGIVVVVVVVVVMEVAVRLMVGMLGPVFTFIVA